MESSNPSLEQLREPLRERHKSVNNTNLVTDSTINHVKNYGKNSIQDVSLINFLIRPVPQDPQYHNFADHKSLTVNLGLHTHDSSISHKDYTFIINNYADVLSNLPFICIGLLGLVKSLSLDTNMTFYLMYLGILLTGFGSMYYHLHPTNDTLLWDRLPMAVSFMAFFHYILHSRIHLGLMSLLVLQVIGIASVLYWHHTEQRGMGDLRPYILVQYGPLLLIPLILLFSSKQSSNYYVWLILFYYLLAKISEYYDGFVYRLTGTLISGHTLKHLLSAVGAGLTLLL